MPVPPPPRAGTPCRRPPVRSLPGPSRGCSRKRLRAAHPAFEPARAADRLPRADTARPCPCDPAPRCGSSAREGRGRGRRGRSAGHDADRVSGWGDTAIHEPPCPGRPRPLPFPNVFLTESLPPVPPPADDPKSDLKVEATTALVPRGPLRRPLHPSPSIPTRPVEPAKPHDVWREGLDRLRSVARDRAAETGNESHDLWTLRAQLLDALGEPENASAPEDGALRRTVLTALAALAGPDSKSSQAPALSAKIRAAVEALEDRTPLEITELQLCRKVKRFGDYEPLEAAACRAGHAVILYCEMAGVRYAPEGSLQRSRLASRVEIVAPGGGEPVWTHSLGTADDLCRHRRRDFYVNYRITLPDGLAPGTYELRLIQDDLVAGQTTTPRDGAGDRTCDGVRRVSRISRPTLADAPSLGTQ